MTRLSPNPRISPAAAPWARVPLRLRLAEPGILQLTTTPSSGFNSGAVAYRASQRRRSRCVGPKTSSPRPPMLAGVKIRASKLRQPVGHEPRLSPVSTTRACRTSRPKSLISGFGNHGARLSDILNNGMDSAPATRARSPAGASTRAAHRLVPSAPLARHARSLTG